MKGFKIARIFGINIEINFSLIFIFLFFCWIISTSYLPAALPKQPTMHYWLYGALTTVLFFASLLFHELSHSLLAKRFGIGVERIVLFFLGGVAFLKEECRTAKAEFLMALAGPVSSLVLAAVFWFFAYYSSDFLPAMLSASFKYLALINVGLAAFNLIPAFPMDGGRVFRAILWKVLDSELRATKIAVFLGKVFAGLFFAAGIYFIIAFRDLWSGLWIIFIAWFLFSASSNYGRQLEPQRRKE